MTQIQWTKCSERMPPDKPGNPIIFKTQSGKLRLCSSRWFVNVVVKKVDIDKLEWTPYNEQTWKELNR